MTKANRFFHCIRKIFAMMIVVVAVIQVMVPKAEAATTAAIKAYNYPVSLKAKHNFTVRGVVQSNEKMSSLTVGVFTASGVRKTGRTVCPKAKSYNIYQLRKYINFSVLKKGVYFYRIICSTSTVKNKVILNKKFTVK